MTGPLAYHIIWTSYGSWLPGDERGWVMDGVPGIRAPDPALQVRAAQAMVEDEVALDGRQCEAVAGAIRDHCRFRGWHLYALNVRPTHVHVVVHAEADSEAVQVQLKSWGARTLSDLAGLPKAGKNGRRKWWTEDGYRRAVWDERYLAEVIAYVAERQ